MDLPKLTFIQKMSTRELTILIFTLLIVVGVGYYKFEWEGLQKQRKELEGQIAQADQGVQSFQAALGMVKPEKMVQEIAKVRQDIEDIKMEIDLTKGKMTEKVADIVRVLGDQAKFQKAQLVTFNSREKLVEKENGMEYKEVTLFLTIKSNYGAIGDFVDALERIPAVMMVRDLEIKRQRETHPRVETDITIKLFVL